MPDISQEVISNSALRARVQLMELFNNILSAVEENTRESTKAKITALFDQFAVNQVPWNEQLIKLQFKIMENDELSQETKSQMLKVVTEEYNKSQNLAEDKQKETIAGFEELKKTVKRSRLPKEDKQILFHMIDKAIYDLHAPHQITVDRASYRQIVKLLNQTGLMSQISAIHTVSDEYLIMYNAGLEPQMEQIVQIAGLSIGRIPRPDIKDIMAYLDCVEDKDNKGKGNLIWIKDLTPELAEKAVLESTKSRNFSFAKTDVKENGKVDILCFGGVAAEEKQKYYQQAIQTVAMAAYTLTGKTGDFEKRRARHMAAEQKKIDHILSCIENDTVDPEDQGYIYSINSVTDSNGNRFILTDDYVKFGPESFTHYFNGNADVVTVDQCEDYIRTLRLNLQSGPGQKAYISLDQKHELDKMGLKAQDLVQSLSADNRLDQVAELVNKRDEIRDQLKHSAGLNAQIRTSLLEDLTITNIAMDTLMYHTRDKDLTSEMFISAAIGYELKSREPQHIRTAHSKEEVENADITDRAMSDYLHRSEKIKTLDINQAGVYDLQEIFNSADFGDFLQREFDRAEAVSEDLPDGTFTVDDVKHEMEVLNQDFRARCIEASELLSGIAMEIGHNPQEHDQTQTRVAEATIGRHQTAWKKFYELLAKADLELADPQMQHDDIEHTSHSHSEQELSL
ncbi:hypothetical protein [Butyrivibrio sp.]|uniref:hypothetical protein n=1 Tax=Butyrivibrio sp. TaxID=28121 RepID=UPI0025BE169E|nr:hypothetical protein [Butyrivibrio sp.]MBQ7430222.1 hypothetical protein [Butyrivibrio sp.]MBQ9303396.1 hypothetical protein [Butyrivibrio sp.]